MNSLPPFSDSIVFSFLSSLENSVFKKHRFQMLHSGERFRMAPFSVIVFGVVVWTIALIRSKTAPFSFENGLVWTGPNMDSYPVAHPPFFSGFAIPNVLFWFSSNVLLNWTSFTTLLLSAESLRLFKSLCYWLLKPKPLDKAIEEFSMVHESIHRVLQIWYA